jgi:hypothetical protein
MGKKPKMLAITGAGVQHQGTGNTLYGNLAQELLHAVARQPLFSRGFERFALFYLCHIFSLSETLALS